MNDEELFRMLTDVFTYFNLVQSISHNDTHDVRKIKIAAANYALKRVEEKYSIKIKDGDEE